MTRLKKALGASVLVLLLVTALPLDASAGAKQKAKIQDAIEVLDEIMAIPEQGIPPALLRDAQGIAIIPGILKVGFVIGGRHGSGIVMMRNDSGRWGNPVFVTFTGGSIGWQIGAESADVILVFKNKQGIRDLINAKFTLGADAAVAAGPVGRHAEAGTDVMLKAEIYSYSRSRGLFAGLSLEGSALQVDKDDTALYYGTEEFDTTAILEGRGGAPAQVGDLRATLNRYSGTN